MTKDYNAKLRQDYEDIKRKVESGMLPLVARVPAIDNAVTEYALARAEHYHAEQAKGKNPPIAFKDSAALEKYADLILYEELKWSHPDKMTIVEYPVMTNWQEGVREEKSIKLEEITYRDRQHNGRKKASYFGDDGEVGVSNPKMPDRFDKEIERMDDKIDVGELLDSANLTDRQRQVIDLIFFEDMTQGQAGEVMGVSDRGLRYHLDAALTKLRRNLTKSTS